MCTANSRRICLLCLLLYCVTCVKSGRNPNVPRGGSRRVDNDDAPTTTLLPLAKVTEPDAYYMQKDFFVGELMSKYGDGDKILYEGLEHLLYNLGLGGMEKLDHGIQCHKTGDSSKFLDLHIHHNHSNSAVGPQVNTSCDQYDSVHSHDQDHNHVHDDHEITDHDHSHDDHDHSNDNHDHSHDDHDHSHDDHSHDDHDHSHTDESTDNEMNSNDNVNTDTDTTASTVLNDTLEVNGSDSHINHEHSDIDDRTRRRRSDYAECLSTETLVQAVKSDVGAGLTKEEFKELCPSLIYQLDTDACHTHNHASGDHHHDHDHNHDHAHDSEVGVSKNFSNVSAKVWGFSTIAVIVISLVGLLGVAVIPIMQKVFYNHLLQFLVALAVGALSGDALLHLLPHAMGNHVHGGGGDDGHGHDHEEEHDPSMIYKGLCGLMGIFFFFWSERLLTIFTESKRRKKEMKNKAKKYINQEEQVGSKLADQCDGMMMSIHPNKALQDYALEAHKEHCIKQFDDEFVSHRHGPCPNGDVETAMNGEERISMIDNHPKSHHGHGHSHGIDGVPTSVASVAWMVIMGDGIHNFCDGLAIGAAFVNSITGGFSTTIAVLCHELPHEIGDFAMLLRAGMTAKQAIFYNCVSSILCFVGMLVGVAIGNIGGATLWVFALVGGMFLYIALVDMLPELSSVDTKKGEHPLCHLLLQILGMLLGAGVMLIIALYEEDLINILDKN